MSLIAATKGLLRSYNLRPKKRLGQIFLVDEDVLSKIIKVADLSPSDTVLEIGAGLGVLTGEIAKRAKKVIAIEKDRELVRILKDVLKFDNVEIVEGDMLEKYEPEAERLGSDYKIIGNLPYYITSPIIEKLLETATFSRRFPMLIVLTVQKEVAERLVSKPGNKQYGSFSIFVQNHAEVAIDSIIPRDSFWPKPGVESAIIILKPYSRPKYKIDHKLVQRAFQQRRKMISNSLKDYEIDFDKVGIDPKRRPETLSLEEFELLSKNL